MPGTLILNEICDLLETYKGRDKVLRTLCYSTKLISGLTNDGLLSKRFQIFSSKMSETRTVLRLMDDFAMIKYNLEYGLGRQEPDKIMSILGVITNFIDQIYYPIEKVAWLAENRLISLQNSGPWDTASSVCWVFSIYLSLLRSLRQVYIFQQLKSSLHKNADKEIIDMAIRSQRFEMLTCIRLSLDFVHAVNTLPPGYLWSAKFKPWHVGLIGTVSSLVGIYQIFAKRSLK